MKLAYVVFSIEGQYAFPEQEHDFLLNFLQQKGLNIQRNAWSDETIDWTQFDCIVLKAPWDYVEKPIQFYQWLDEMALQNIPLLNPADIVKWNCDKHYLKEIADAGLRVIPSAFIERGEHFNSADHFEAFDTDTLIVKPCISGSSKNTFLVGKDDAESAGTINTLLQKEAMMVQPFIPHIKEEGEWALLFFGGKFSHALVKTPANGDFRCQQQFGGSVQATRPTAALLQAATEYVSKFAKGCLYARVDGLVVDNVFYLMELELVDPVLFLAVQPGSEENYYAALQSLLQSNVLSRHNRLLS